MSTGNEPWVRIDKPHHYLGWIVLIAVIAGLLYTGWLYHTQQIPQWRLALYSIGYGAFGVAFLTEFRNGRLEQLTVGLPFIGIAAVELWIGDTTNAGYLLMVSVALMMSNSPREPIDTEDND